MQCEFRPVNSCNTQLLTNRLLAQKLSPGNPNQISGLPCAMIQGSLIISILFIIRSFFLEKKSNEDPLSAYWSAVIKKTISAVWKTSSWKADDSRDLNFYRKSNAIATQNIPKIAMPFFWNFASQSQENRKLGFSRKKFRSLDDRSHGPLRQGLEIFVVWKMAYSSGALTLSEIDLKSWIPAYRFSLGDHLQATFSEENSWSKGWLFLIQTIIFSFCFWKDKIYFQIENWLEVQIVIPAWIEYSHSVWNAQSKGAFFEYSRK